MHADVLQERLARLTSAELAEALQDQLAGEGKELERALAAELVRRAAEAERVLDAYAALLVQERRSA